MNRCAKREVVAVLVAASGAVYVGRNDREASGPCPRAPGDGYSACASECVQPRHAEVAAIEAAKDDALGGSLYLFGHGHACRPCLDAAEAAGVAAVIVVDPGREKEARRWGTTKTEPGTTPPRRAPRS